MILFVDRFSENQVKVITPRNMGPGGYMNKRFMRGNNITVTEQHCANNSVGII